MKMIPAMVPYLLQVGQWTYQEAQLFWKEASRVVDRVEMVPSGKRISTSLSAFQPARRETGHEKNGVSYRSGNDAFRKWMERQLFPHLGQLVDAYI